MKLFFIAVLFMSALPSLAQTRVTGCVVDSLSRQPLKGAAVTLTRGGRAVSFGKTDEKGRFSVAAQGGDSLQVTFLGYAKKRVAAVKGHEMVVEMMPKAFALKEVQVKGMPVFGRQDTTFFDLKRYTSASDNTLKDVLKKLPGVDVADDGTVSFNGKDVSRFTIEDLDLAGGRYNQLNELLKARDVDRAEVIEHDQPVKALQGKVFTDDVAMNIRLRPEARDKWMFTLRPGAVVTTPLEDTRPQGGADALQIGKRRQRMYAAMYDRSGRDLTQADALLATGGTAAYGGGVDVPQWFAAPQLAAPIDAERLRFNSSYNFAVKQTRKTKAGSEQRWTAGYLHADETQQTGNTSTYYFDGKEPVTTDETANSAIRRDRIYADFNHNTNTAEAYGNEYFIVEGTLADGSMRIDGEEKDGIRQRVKLPELHAQNTFTRLFSRERHSWQVYSNVDFHYAPHEMTVDGRRQKLTNILYYTDNYARLTLNRRFLTHRYDLGLAAEHLNLQGRHTRLTVHSAPFWQYKRVGTIVRMDVPMKWTVFTDRGEHYLDASPSLQVTVKTGMRGELNVGSGYSMRTGGWGDFAVSRYMRDYRTLVENCGAVPRTGTFYANAAYTYKRPVAELFMSATLGYNHSHGNLMTDLSIDGGRYTLVTVRRGWQQDAVSAKAAVSKGFFSLHLKTKLVLQYTFGTGQQLSGGEVTGYTSDAWQASPEVVFTPGFGMFTYRATFTLNRMKTDGIGGNSLFDWKQSLAYTQTVGRVDVTAAAVHYRNELQQGATVSTLLADASVVWRLKKVRLSLDVRNIFDKRRYAVTTYSGVMSSTGWYELRPREAVVGVQVSL